MRLMYWGITFVIAVIVALALVLTFIQPEFNTRVGAQLFTYKTKQLPVYYYVIGAFALGLLVGIAQAITTFIRAKGKLFRKNHHIKELEKKLDEAQMRISQLENEAKPRESISPAFQIKTDPIPSADESEL